MSNPSQEENKKDDRTRRRIVYSPYPGRGAAGADSDRDGASRVVDCVLLRDTERSDAIDVVVDEASDNGGSVDASPHDDSSYESEWELSSPNSVELAPPPNEKERVNEHHRTGRRGTVAVSDVGGSDHAVDEYYNDWLTDRRLIATDTAKLLSLANLLNNSSSVHNDRSTMVDDVYFAIDEMKAFGPLPSLSLPDSSSGDREFISGNTVFCDRCWSCQQTMSENWDECAHAKLTGKMCEQTISQSSAENEDAPPNAVPMSSEDDGYKSGDSDMPPASSLIWEMREKWKSDVQKMIARAILWNPIAIRAYCIDASIDSMNRSRCRFKGGENDDGRQRRHQALRRSRLGGRIARPTNQSRPFYYVPRTCSSDGIKWHMRLVQPIVHAIVGNLPVSILMQLADGAFDTTIDVSVAIYRVSLRSIWTIVEFSCYSTGRVWHFTCQLNPWAAVDFTTDVLASGIQSVAEGVGSTTKSASVALQHRFAVSGVATGLSRAASTSSVTTQANKASSIGGSHSRSARSGGAASFLLGKIGIRSVEAVNNALSEKLFRKLSKIDSAASRVISYKEQPDEVLSHHAKQRVQRMMHYDISLKPFLAKVAAPNGKCATGDARRMTPRKKKLRGNSGGSPNSTFSNMDYPQLQSENSITWASSMGSAADNVLATDGDCIYRSSSESSFSTSGSPFMCTPKSFPPSPCARSMVMARGARFAEDVVFLARDQLRVRGALESNNDRTRAMALSLKEGRRLAVFSAEDAGNGVALTCGHHCATKTGNVLYCSTRCMVPVLRNCYVYFEMSVGTSTDNLLQHPSMSSLAMGLSTLEMPNNTLVGAWKSSIGLCTTGQILSAGQWYSPNNDPRFTAFGSKSTVGCLVRLDDESAFETWDGVMVTASICFNVDGKLVLPPSCMGPFGGSALVPQTHGVTDNSVVGYSVDFAAGFNQVGTPGLSSITSLPLFVPREEELFPTLTLHSTGTKVMCRFCAEDILAKTRDSIGVPRGVVVYAVDGSVLFDESVDRRRCLSVSSDDEMIPADCDNSQLSEFSAVDNINSFSRKTE